MTIPRKIRTLGSRLGVRNTTQFLPQVWRSGSSASGLTTISVISMRFPASAMATTLCIGHNFVTNPRVRQIYSTVDYDAQPSDMTQIKAFFTAFAKSIRGAGYKVGCYGSGYTCNQLLAAKLIDYTWITCSSGFRDSKTVIQQGTYDIWQVFGLCDQIYQGLSIDWDAANPMRNGDWGQIILESSEQSPPRPARACGRIVFED